MPAIGAGGREHALKLDAGNDVPVSIKPVFTLDLRIEFVDTGRKDDRAHVQLHDFILHGMVNGLLVAGRDALVTFGTEGAVKAAFGFSYRVVD
jgi:hypothetical protein